MTTFLSHLFKPRNKHQDPAQWNCSRDYQCFGLEGCTGAFASPLSKSLSPRVEANLPSHPPPADFSRLTFAGAGLAGAVAASYRGGAPMSSCRACCSYSVRTGLGGVLVLARFGLFCFSKLAAARASSTLRRRAAFLVLHRKKASAMSPRMGTRPRKKSSMMLNII